MNGMSARKVLYVLAGLLVAAVLVSCGSVKTAKAGTPDVAHLEFVGDTDKYGAIYVSIDGGSAFEARVNDIDKNKHKYSYEIPTGSHDILVRSGGATVVSKKIFASVNEVKEVVLP